MDADMRGNARSNSVQAVETCRSAQVRVRQLQKSPMKAPEGTAHKKRSAAGLLPHFMRLAVIQTLGAGMVFNSSPAFRP